MHLNKKSCQNCLYLDQCPAKKPCSHYYPIDEDGELADDLIEQGRQRFYDEWRSYMMESQDSDF